MIRRTLVGIILIIASVSAADPAPRVDREGVPLPAEAVQRLGSAKFLVNNLKAATFSPDGKVVYTISDADQHDDRVAYSSPGLIAWEVPTGKKLWQVGVDRRFEQVAAYPDGKSLWVIERYELDGDFEFKSEERVRYSAADGKELARTPLVASDYETIALHPTGLTASPVWKSAEDMGPDSMSIRLTDRDEMTSDIRPIQLAREGRDYGVIWSPKADRLFVVTKQDDRKAACLTALDTATRKQLWSRPTDVPGGWCVSPDGRTLFVVTESADKPDDPPVARKLDATTGKELSVLLVPNVRCMPDLGSEMMNDFGLIHLGPDGKTLYLIDRDERTIAIDVATWKKVESKIRVPEHAVFSRDGRMLVAPSGRQVVIQETATGKRFSPDGPKFSRTIDEVLVPYTTDESVTHLRFSPNSDRVIRSGGYDGVWIEWETESGLETSRIKLKEPDRNAKWNVVSADGKKKASEKQEGKNWRIAVTNVGRPNDKVVTLNGKYKGDDSPCSWLQFTPDGNHLVGFSRVRTLLIWDAVKGGDPVEVNFPLVGIEYTNFRTEVQIQSDSRRVAVLEFNGRPGRGQFVLGPMTFQIGVYELPSGKLIQRHSGTGAIDLLRWTQSGVVVGITNCTPQGNPFFELERRSRTPKFELFCLEPSTKRKHVSTLDHDVRASAVAPFGDMVAVGSSDGLRLYEASTGRLRHRFREQTRPVQVLAFSPNGRYLAAESVDGPVLVWDVRGDLNKPAKPDTAGWEAAWKAVGEDGAESAFRAIRLFALYPDEGSAELAKRFTDLKPPSDEAITALVRKLDDRDFKTRDQAGKDLKALGFTAFPALKNALADNPSLELQERANKLLAVTMPPDRLRAERAVEAMLLADTEAARKQLAEWAKGPASDPLTVAAKRTVK